MQCEYLIVTEQALDVKVTNKLCFILCSVCVCLHVLRKHTLSLNGFVCNFE